MNMNEAEAKQHLRDMLAKYDPGTVVHFLAQTVREAEEARGRKPRKVQPNPFLRRMRGEGIQ